MFGNDVKPALFVEEDSSAVWVRGLQWERGSGDLSFPRVRAPATERG